MRGARHVRRRDELAGRLRQLARQGLLIGGFVAAAGAAVAWKLISPDRGGALPPVPPAGEATPRLQS
ncbi:MAG: hypothetical protein KY463_13460, partial [Actinobacteria bacterium]|nr:hypothetical protein [Actinomycetota bacterium]